MRLSVLWFVVGAIVVAPLVGCSSTAGSSGALQDDAVFSASSVPSAGGSLAASPGASAEPVASAVASSAGPSAGASIPAASVPAESVAADADPTLLGQGSSGTVCDSGLAYACGDQGPGGGLVFYASSTGFPCGPDYASGCNFLEVAPNGWNGKEVDCPNIVKRYNIGTDCYGSSDKTSDWGQAGIGTGRGYSYCTGMGEKNAIPNASGTAVGTGYSNTQSMVANCVSGDAGQLAMNYSGGGLDDWYLPAYDELSALFASSVISTIGGISQGVCYWTSTQASGSDSAKSAWSVGWGPSSGIGLKKEHCGVRPIRAF